MCMLRCEDRRMGLLVEDGTWDVRTIGGSLSLHLSIAWVA